MLSASSRSISRRLTDCRALSSVAALYQQQPHHRRCYGLMTHFRGDVADCETLSSSINCTNNACQRFYVSRAHPKPTPVFSVKETVEDILKDVRRRKRRRQRKWNRNQKNLVSNQGNDDKATEGGENEKPADTENENPTDAENEKPADTENEQPAEDSPVVPTEQNNNDENKKAIAGIANTTDTENEQPADPENEQPGETENEQPADTENEKPARTENEKPAETFSHPDENVELAVNLNLDPRKPGQSLRGSVRLPHGSGKNLNCVVFTDDADLREAALEAGALRAGGESLVDEIVVDGTVPVESFQVALATPDVMQTLSRKAARLLGPRGLMPNAKSGTLLSTHEELLAVLGAKIVGKEVSYRTDKAGIVHVVVGKASFGSEKLLENIGEVMKTLIEAKPEQYGKGKKGKALAKSGKGTKYVLRVSVSSTQGPGIRVDWRTVDPSSPFFLGTVVKFDSVSKTSGADREEEKEEYDVKSKTSSADLEEGKQDSSQVNAAA